MAKKPSDSISILQTPLFRSSWRNFILSSSSYSQKAPSNLAWPGKKKHHLHGSDQSINLSLTNEEIQTWNNTRILLQHTNWCPNIYTGTTFVEIVWTERCSLDRLEIVIRFWTSQKRFQQGLVHFRQPLYRFTQHSLQTKS